MQQVEAESLLREAHAARDRGDLASALRSWMAAAEAYPASPIARLEAVEALTGAGQASEAERLLEETVRMFPEDFWVARRVAIAAEQAAGGSASAAAWRALSERFPGEPLAHTGLAQALRASGDLDGAEAAARRALEIAPDVWAADMLATLAMDRGDWEEAARRWAAVRRDHPDHARAYAEGVAALERCGRPDDAREVADSLDAAVERASDRHDLLMTQAELVSRQERWEAAAERWGRIVSAYPAEISAYIRLAQSLMGLGRLEDAEAVYRRGLLHMPRHPVLSLELLAVLLDQRRLDVAMPLVTQLAGQTEKPPLRFYHLASRVFVQQPGDSRTLLLAALQQPWERGHAWVPEILEAINYALNFYEGTFPVAERIVGSVTEDEAGPAGAAVFEAVSLYLFRERWAEGDMRAVLRRYIEQGQTALLLALSEDAVQNGRDVSRYGVREPLFELAREMLAGDLRGFDREALFSLAALGWRCDRTGYRRVLDLAFSESDALDAEAAAAVRRWFKPPTAPAARVSERGRLRIALCVSGQLRGFRRAFPTWQRLRLDQHEVVTAVHVWSDIGRKLPVAPGPESRSPRLAKVYWDATREIDNRMLRTWYPSFFAPVPVDPEALKALYGTDLVVVEDERGPGFAAMSNAAKMYYKIQQAHALARTAGDFDLIIRTRPDKVVASAAPDWRELLLRSRREAVVFSDRGKVADRIHNLLIGDQWAAGAAELMDVYAAADDLPGESAPLGRPLVGSQVEAHATMALACFFSGVDVETTPDIEFGPLLEAEPASPEQLLAMLEADVGPAPRNRVDEALLAAAREDLAG